MTRTQFGLTRRSSDASGSQARGRVPRAAAVAALLVLGTIGQALARPPPGTDMNSPAAHWYSGLKQPVTGYTCCSIADCRPVDERIGPHGHYEIRLRATADLPQAPSHWWQVPDKAVLHGHTNPTGEPIACYDLRRDGTGSVAGITFFCFVPDAGT